MGRDLNDLIYLAGKSIESQPPKRRRCPSHTGNVILKVGCGGVLQDNPHNQLVWKVRHN